jgi:hypothetical protein
MTRLLKTTLTVAAALCTATALQAINITPVSDAEILVNSILGPGVTLVPGSAVYHGHPEASGLFDDGISSGLGIDQGIILATGRAVDAQGPNNNGHVAETSTRRCMIWNTTASPPC